MIRVLIVAPAPTVRAGLRALLVEDAQIEIAGEAASLDEAGDMLPDLGAEIDVWVIVEAALNPAEDVSPRPGDLFRNAASSTALLLVADRPDPIRFLPGMTNRAWGVLPLDSSPEELQAAVRALHQGLLVGAPELMEQVLTTQAQNGDILDQPGFEALTERELQVLELLAQGLANKQIALQLGISEHTVKFHISGIYSKLRATSRTEAVRLGVRQGLIVL